MTTALSVNTNDDIPYTDTDSMADIPTTLLSGEARGVSLLGLIIVTPTMETACSNVSLNSILSPKWFVKRLKRPVPTCHSKHVLVLLKRLKPHFSMYHSQTVFCHSMICQLSIKMTLFDVSFKWTVSICRSADIFFRRTTNCIEYMNENWILKISCY